MRNSAGNFEKLQNSDSFQKQQRPYYSIPEWRAKVHPLFRDPTVLELWDEDWRAAFGALRLQKGQTLLSEMFGRAGFPGALPVPPWVFHDLQALTDPEANHNDVDQLVYQRSDALRGKVKTNEDKIAIGVAIYDLIEAGDKRKTAMGKVIKNLETEGEAAGATYIKDCMARGKTLPEFWKATYARNSAIYRVAIGEVAKKRSV